MSTEPQGHTLTSSDDSGGRNRGWTQETAAACVLAALMFAALAKGAFYAVAAAGVAVLLVVAASVSMAGRRWSRGDLGSLAGASMLVLAAWALVRSAAISRPGAGLELAMVVLGCLVVMVITGRLGADGRTWFVAGLLGIGGVVALSGWFGVVTHRAPWGHLDGTSWRAGTTLTYENAAAGLLVPLGLLALGLAARASSVPTRRAYAAAAVVILTGALATLSRAGAVALAIGLAVLAFAIGRAASGLVAPLLGTGIAVAGLLPSIPQGTQGAFMLAAAGLACGIALSWLPQRMVVAAAAVVLVLASFRVGPMLSAWIPVAGPRLSPVSIEREEQAAAALELWSSNPLIGVGPGSATLTWQRTEGLAVTARYVHNEYLQVLVDLGLIGAATLLVLIFGVVRLVYPISRSRLPFGAAEGAVAGLAAFATHSLFDFLWHVPVVPLAASALVGIAAHRKEEP